MPGAINFTMADLYGGGYAGTAEMSVPEAADQNALVDSEVAAEAVTSKTKNKLPIFGALVGVVVVALLMGAVK